MENASVESNDILLETVNLRKQFGGLVAVDNVSMKIRARQLHSIIGPNGAGKTTFFNLLSGTLPPTSGQIFYKGENITRLAPHRVAHLGIGRSFQITKIFPNLTVLENIRLAAQAMGGDNLKLFRHYSSFNGYIDSAMQVIEQVGLKGRESLLASALPHGDKRKLELGIMLASNPEVLLLDEPTAGMSSEQVPALLDIIRSILANGDKTIVLVEHRMDMVMSISDSITVMHEGRILAEGSPHEIASNETVQSAYLGALYGDLLNLEESR